jgi:F0F1-type ATP synthase epsilon subunit
MSHKPEIISNLSVVARAPFQIYYEGLATAVTAINQVGEFDILPGHADFFSMLVGCEVVIETNTEPVKFTITNGIITVRDNEVMLFVNV